VVTTTGGEPFFASRLDFNIGCEDMLKAEDGYQGSML
jgi:hypothetical protein